MTSAFLPGLVTMHTWKMKTQIIKALFKECDED